MWPSIRAVGLELPLVEMAFILMGVVTFGVGCTLFAAHVATARDLLEALRSE